MAPVSRSVARKTGERDAAPHLTLNEEKGPTMLAMRLAIAALVSIGFVGAPFAVEAKKHRPVEAKKHRSVEEKKSRQSRRHTILSGPYRASGERTGPYRATGGSALRPGSYGTSGTAVGTVTAPSVGSYNWPTVGVTNAVPTWKNTNPPVRR